MKLVSIPVPGLQRGRTDTMRKNSLKPSRSSVNGTNTGEKDDADALSRSVSFNPGEKPKGTPKSFAFRDLALATKNFNAELLLGQGGFGRVYKGHLKKTNQVIAVKQLDRNGGVQDDKEFLSEVQALGTIHHPNLVNFIGYCADGRQRILVHEYMHNGSLENHLFDLPSDKVPLDWYVRMKIAQGAAQGLQYLHDTASPSVVFQDLKASSILLDQDFNAKLSDFGLTKLCLQSDCAPPEYAQTGQLTAESDVYRFGVVFLEIISGRRAVDHTKPREQENLVEWAKTGIFNDRSKFVLLADPLLEEKYPVKGLCQAVTMAAMCLQDEASTRPLIRDVVTALEYLAIMTNEGTSETDN